LTRKGSEVQVLYRAPFCSDRTNLKLAVDPVKSLLTDKWVLITGASSGFGAAAAIEFARRGARLLLGARRVDRLAAIAEQARKEGSPQAVFHFLDVASTASVNEYIGWVKSVTPRMDVLVNNAGGALGLDPVSEGKDSDWETMLQTNVLGVLRMVRAALPLMLPYPGGIIINIGSVAGRTAYEGGAAYCAAKAGELQITRALRLELCGTGLRVATIDPGMAETEFSLVRFKGDEKRAAQVYEGVQPLKAEDVAEAIVWVAERPPHVCIDEMVIKCTDQAAVYKVHRRTRQ
jgi:3-hydroxy acid dehydrogenase/malonic semialdehyde reductase